MPCSTKGDWLRIAIDFVKKWNFPNYVAAVDGKYVLIKSLLKQHLQLAQWCFLQFMPFTALLTSTSEDHAIRPLHSGTLAGSEFGVRLSDGKLCKMINHQLITTRSAARYRCPHCLSIDKTHDAPISK